MKTGVHSITNRATAVIAYRNHLFPFRTEKLRLYALQLTLQMEEELMKVTEGVAAINIIGSGGNINKLFRLADKKDKKLQRLPVSSLQTVYDVLKPLTPEERVEAFSLKQDRADVIVPAAEIFLKIAEVVHAEYIYVPVIGLSDGIIDNLYAKSLEKEMKAE